MLGAYKRLEGQHVRARAVLDTTQEAVADGAAEVVTGAAHAARGAEEVLVCHGTEQRIATERSVDNRFDA